MQFTSLLLASTMISATPATVTDGVFPYNVQRAALDNGLTVLMVPMPSEGLVSYWSIVRTGSRDEVEEGVTGFAHFFEHMMFRGSEKYPGEVYDGIVKQMGADQNAYTTDDYTAYHMSFTSEDLSTVIEIEADRFQNLQYTEAEFRTEAGAVFGEYRKGRTNPFYVLFEALQNAAFDAHTYKHMTIGFVEDIEAMPDQFEYSKSFFERFYRPENVTILVAGDFDPRATMAMIEEHYAGWKKGYVAPDVKPEPPQTAQRRITVPFEGQTLPILTLAFKGDSLKPDDRTMIAATLMGELAFGATSPLYKKLFLEEQRVDAMFEDFGYNRDPNLWAVFARVKDPADMRNIEREIWTTIQGLQETPVSAERLADVASRLKYGFLSSLSTPSEVAGNMARLIAITGGIEAVDRMYATLDQVTPEDVQRAARTFLKPETCTVAVMHSESEPAPPNMDEVGGFAPIGSFVSATTPEDTPPTAESDIPVVAMPVQDPNVSFNIWFQVGSQDDPSGKEGLAALTASLLSDGGTRRLAYDEILEQLFPIAAGYSFSVDKEMTVVRGGVHRERVDEFYELFVEAILEPGFRPEDFERVRDQTVTFIENQLRFASDEELGKAALYGRVFEGTPYEHLTSGTVQSLKSITLQDVESFYRRHYTRDTVVIGIGGAYEADLPARLSADLAGLPSGASTAPPVPTPTPIDGRELLLVEKPGPTAAISFGYPIDVHRGSREFYALWIANSWLGEHRNSASHLYQVIREARGMNYGDYSYIEAFPGGGRRSMPPTGVGRRQQLFEVWIRPVPRDQAAFALRAALREIDKLVANGMSAEDFENTKRFLEKYSLHFAETTAERLGYAVDDRFYGIDQHLATFREMMGEITHEEVNAAIKKHIQIDDLVIAIVAEDAEGLAAQFVAGEPSPMVYAADNEKPAEVLAEDKEIERFPLNIDRAKVTIVPVEEMFEGGSVREASSTR